MNNPTNPDLPLTCERRIPVALLTLRLSVFLVMFMWTLLRDLDTLGVVRWGTRRSIES